MNKPIRIAAAAAALGLLALDAAAQAPRIPAYDPAGQARACDEGLVRVRGIVAEMSVKPGAEGIFEEWNRLFIETENAANHAYLYAAVHPDKEVRAALESRVRALP